MCLLIYVPAGGQLEESWLDNGFKNNPDGAGIAYIKDKRLAVVKGLKTVEQLKAAIEAAGATTMMIHMRAASAGTSEDMEFTHPFAFDSSHLTLPKEGDAKEESRFDFALAHNGRLSFLHPTSKTSDTKMFVDSYMSKILSQNPWHFNTKPNLAIMEYFIGTSNKLIVAAYDRLNDEDYWWIIGKDHGIGFTSSDHSSKAHFKGDIWMSNYSYEPPKPKAKVWTDGEFIDYSNYYRGKVTHHYPAYTKPAGTMSKDEFSKKTDSDTLLFCQADEQGWRWDYAQDKWLHVTSGATAMVLAHRPIRPKYMELREQRLADATKTTQTEVLKLESVKESTAKDPAQAAIDKDAKSHVDEGSFAELVWARLVELYGNSIADGHPIEGPKGIWISIPKAPIANSEKKVLYRAAARFCKLCGFRIKQCGPTKMVSLMAEAISATLLRNKDCPMNCIERIVVAMEKDQNMDLVAYAAYEIVGEMERQ